MAAVAHGWKKPGGDGPSPSVAKEFNKADKGRKALSRALRSHEPKVMRDGNETTSTETVSEDAAN